MNAAWHKVRRILGQIWCPPFFGFTWTKLVSISEKDESCMVSGEGNYKWWQIWCPWVLVFQEVFLEKFNIDFFKFLKRWKLHDDTMSRGGNHEWWQIWCPWVFTNFNILFFCIPEKLEVTYSCADEITSGDKFGVHGLVKRRCWHWPSAPIQPPSPPHPSLETFPIFPQLMKMHFMRFSNQEWAGVSIHWTFEKSIGFRYWARWIRTKAICTFYEKNQTRAFFVSLSSDYSGLGGDIDVDNDCHPWCDFCDRFRWKKRKWPLAFKVCSCRFQQ